MYILGISAYYHDSAVALIHNGQILAAAQEERFTRIKHDSSFPRNAILSNLRQCGIKPAQLDWVAFYDKPFLKFERLMETYLALAPKGFSSFRKAIPVWIREKLFQKNLLRKELNTIDPNVDWESKLLFSEHHISHAASAFFPSPFEQALVLTMDGVGEWTTTSAAIGNGNSLQLLRDLQFPHSLGLLYSAFTYYIGFKVNSGEYKVMGLAPYGRPIYAKTILDHLIDVKRDGSFRLNMQYFDYCTGLTMTSSRFHELFEGPPRQTEQQVTQREMDLAASIQAVLEEVVLKMTRALAQETGAENLCLAGGVALNCVANGKILRDGQFKKIWIQPAAGDAGGALGAALAAYHMHAKQSRSSTNGHDGMNGAYLGPEFSQAEIESRLTAAGAKYEVMNDEYLLTECARALSQEQALGWFQGRMEFGPRALGARSILGDPRSPRMQSLLNLKVKFRESFRPFAPSILREKLQDYFELNCDSPYMSLVADVLPRRRISMTKEQQALFGIDQLNIPRSDIPAVTHVDYSARIQTVHIATNPRYYTLISAFQKQTGVPVLINTSFNVRGEPIVCSPEDAFRCFMGTDLDLLAIGNCLLRKPEQDAALLRNYRDQFELD